jgi:general secretion pathway protein I
LSSRAAPSGTAPTRARPPTRRRAPGAHGAAGFTLIEVLVALSVVAFALGAIGSLIGASVRGTRAVDYNVVSATTARALASALPTRDALKPGSLTGERGGQRWRIDIGPVQNPVVDPALPTRWVPHAVVIRVQSPTGGVFQINTVRLQRREGG